MGKQDAPANNPMPVAGPTAPSAVAAPAAAPAPEADADLDAGVSQALNQAQASLDQLQGMTQPLALPDLAAGGAAAEAGSIALLSDVELHVVVELGRTQMLVEDVLRLSDGSIVELDKLAGDPVDVYVNQRLVARGEVLVLNDNFCIRISEIVANLVDQAQAGAESPARGA